MIRPDADGLDDIATAITSIRSHLQHGPISVEIVMEPSLCDFWRSAKR